MLKNLPKTTRDDLLIGYEHSDDAAVIKLTDDIAVIQTIDFFPSMVTEPELFGQIAAANALSDVYAMGGTPVCALNVAMFPQNGNFDILHAILVGGTKKVVEAGAALVGGHTVDNKVPIYGLSVMGTVHPKRLWANSTAAVGDVLFLTKPLGIGLITGAYNAGEISSAAFDKAVSQMVTLNKYAADVLHSLDQDGKTVVTACTDVTGFGLLGHALEMLGKDNSGTKSLRLYRDGIPYIQESYEAAKEFLITGGAQNNRQFVGDAVRFDFDDYAYEEILFDPQTSGGLLFAVAAKDAGTVQSAFDSAHVPVRQIGSVENYQDKKIIVQ